MPPETNAIKRASQHPDASEGVLTHGEQQILGMYDSTGAGLSLAKNEWDVEEEFDTYVKIAREEGEGTTKLAAIRQMNRRLREIAELNGLIVKGSQHVRGRQGDASVEVTQQTSRLCSRVRGCPDLNPGGPFAGRLITAKLGGPDEGEPGD